MDPKRAPSLLSKVGESTEQVKEKLVRPACRSVVRDVLNSLRSEEFYVSEKRFAKSSEARDRLAAVLEPEGVLVRQVILGEHHFNPEYEKVIRDKKLAEQNSERMRSEARAAAEQMKSELQKAKGSVEPDSRCGPGSARHGEALRRRPVLPEPAAGRGSGRGEEGPCPGGAQAERGARRERRGCAGEAEIAESLAGKDLVFLPGGKSGVGLQTLNVNQLIQAVTAREAAQSVPAHDGKPEQPAR